jgi:hypothetical protein
MSVAQITDPVVAICINQQFEYCSNSSDLYECTRGLWRLSRKRAEKAQYAFAVHQGGIKEVYEIEEWVPVYQKAQRLLGGKIEVPGTNHKSIGARRAIRFHWQSSFGKGAGEICRQDHVRSPGTKPDSLF